jgi:hypothetical protein
VKVEGTSEAYFVDNGIGNVLIKTAVLKDGENASRSPPCIGSANHICNQIYLKSTVVSALRGGV